MLPKRATSGFCGLMRLWEAAGGARELGDDTLPSVTMDGVSWLLQPNDGPTMRGAHGHRVGPNGSGHGVARWALR